MNQLLPELNEIRDLYERGQCLDAYHLGLSLGPLQEWKGTEGRVLAGRLAVNLGASRLQHWLQLRAWKLDHSDPEACTYYARVVLERKGPLPAWNVLRQIGDLPHAPPEIRSDWFSFHGGVLGLLRDFDAAEEWLSKAEAIDPQNVWTWIERAAVYEAEDRYEDAIQCARRSLELHPWYRPGVQCLAHILEILDRREEALDLLQEAAQRLQSGPVVGQLARLQLVLQLYEEVGHTLSQLEELSPLMEKELRSWLLAMRSDVAYHTGDIQGAIALARECGEPFYERLAERLEKAPLEDRRVLLPIPFVRQHHMTCAPATLSAISRFWSLQADHQVIAEEICYDGTPNYHQRDWAQRNGLAVREFTVTWESACKLLDRQVPFTLTTTATSSAHLQAVIGYDKRREAFLVRDPYHRSPGELFAAGFLENQQSTGPRGMALVPREQAELLEGIDFPDAALYDHLYRMDECLKRHDRPGAAAALQHIEVEAPGHRLALHARGILAGYDSDPMTMLASVDQLLTLFPADANLQLSRLNYLRSFESRDSCLNLLRDLSTREPSDPIFWQQYAEALSDDARDSDTALWWAMRALRAHPVNALSMAALAKIYWMDHRQADALELYRFAACIADKDERMSRTYFVASRRLKGTDAALRLLENRFRRFGSRSSQPARTLFWALEQADRADRGFDILDQAIERLPDDADLLLFAAGERGRYGQLEIAEALLERSRGRVHHAAWLRTAAALAAYRGELRPALEIWLETLQLEPLALDAHERVAQLLAETESPAAALTHLQEAVARFPHHYGLQRLWVKWLREHQPEAAEPVLHLLVQKNPTDDWARRELAVALSEAGAADEALEQVQIALQMDPHDSYNHACRGLVLQRMGNWREARESFRKAIELSVDNGYAITQLMECCDTASDRRAALEFVEGELARQTVFGDGLLAFRIHAQGVLAPEELLEALQKALDARPDLWHAWSAVVQQLLQLDRRQEALQLAHQAAEAFPLLPATWVDLAAASRAMALPSEEKEALEQALRINVDYAAAIRQLCSAYERAGQWNFSRDLLRRAVARNPLEANYHSWLARTLRMLDEKDAAFESLKRSLLLDPSEEWAWNMLQQWSHEAGQPEQATDLAREMVCQRSGEAQSWLILARILNSADHFEERLGAVRKAIDLSPSLFEAYDLEVEILAEAGRYEEAIRACRTPDGRELPPMLRARRAWIEAERGYFEAAIEAMRALLVEEPHFYWGWSSLAEWYEETGANDEYVQAAQELVRLAPQEASSHGALGSALRRQGNRSAACAAFERAFQISPAYTFAGCSLLDIQLEEKKIDAAEVTLRTLLEQPPAESVIIRAVKVGTLRSDQETTANRLRALCRMPSVSEGSFNYVLSTLKEAAWMKMAITIAQESLQEPDVSPHLGEFWMRACVEAGDWSCEAVLSKLAGGGELACSAASTYLELAADRSRREPVRRFIKEHASWLHGNLAAWGNAGYALYEAGDWNGTIHWLNDWEERPGVQPWMLLNLALALRNQQQHSKAASIGRAALQMPPDYSTPKHRLWLALDAALAGCTAEGQELSEGIDPEHLVPSVRFVAALVQVVLEGQQGSPEERKRRFSSIRRRMPIIQGIYPKYRQYPLLVRSYQRAIRRIAKDIGGPWPLLWSWFQIT